MRNILVRLAQRQGKDKEWRVADSVLEWVLVDIKVWRLEPGVAPTVLLLLHSPWTLSCFPYLRMHRHSAAL